MEGLLKLMKFSEFLQSDLLEFCENKFDKAKDSSKKYKKFKTVQGSIIVYWSSTNSKYKFFFQGNPSEKLDIYDGVKLGLWKQEEFGFVGKIDKSNSPKILQEQKKENQIDLEEYENSLTPIHSYNYRCLWFSTPRNLFKNSKGSLTLPSFLFRGSSFERVGFIEKHPKGFSRYVGGRGLIISRFGEMPKTFFIGESILDIFSHLKILGVEKKDILLIASHGNFSKEMIFTIKVLEKFYKPQKIFTTLDNDPAGENYRKQIESEFSITAHFVPNQKDFLDDLCNS
jgi:hypothetical protein